ncbi:MAG: phosphodiester glycosidase family protein [Chitinispirillia bacterium]|nr:phosphodiester glycosidase family protein [Chitinispirillia bacterium]
MMITKTNPLILCTLILLMTANTQAQWRELDKGFTLGVFLSPLYNQNDNIRNDSAQIRILRIDPKRYELHLLNASHPNRGNSLTAIEWGQKERMSAVINAAMYQTDYKTSVSLMRTSQHVNNPRLSKDNTILVFEPLKKNIPQIRLVDRQCDDFQKISEDYGSMVQSIRMLSCTGKNVWQENGRRWSIAAAGIDKQQNLLFIQSTAPHSVHEFVNILNNLPIKLDRAMYMEGGSPSQLYIAAPSDTMIFIGDFSSGGRSASAPPVPNVLGVRKK